MNVLKAKRRPYRIDYTNLEYIPLKTPLKLWNLVSSIFLKFIKWCKYVYKGVKYTHILMLYT